MHSTSEIHWWYANISIHGNAGNNLASHAENTTFLLHGSPGDGVGYNATHCTFKTTNKSTWAKLLASDLRVNDGRPSGNKIVFIDDGKEEVVRDCSKNSM